MPITINGTGTVAGITAGGLPDGCVATADIADDAVTNDKLLLSANAGEIKKALNADNSPPIYGCRAWVNFDGTTVTNVGGEDLCTIRASGNVAKVVRDGAGRYTITFTTAMPDASYCCNLSGNANNDLYSENRQMLMVRARATGSVKVQAVNDDNNGADNISYLCAAIFR